MSLRDCLKDLNHSPNSFLIVAPKPSSSAVSIAVYKLVTTLNQKDLIEIQQPEHIVDRLLAYWNKHQSLGTVSSRDLRHCTFLLYQEGTSGTRIIDDNVFFDNVLAQVRTKWPQLAIRNLTYQYLDNYDPNSKVNSDIFGLISRAPDNRRPILLNAMYEYKLMSRRNGTNTLARSILESNDSIENLLDVRHMSGVLSQSSFAEHSFKVACDLVHKKYSRRHYVDQLIKWAGESDPKGGVRERYPKTTVELAKALLEPWAGRKDSPSPELEARIKNLMLGSLRDPRLPGSSPKWDDIPIARDVIKKWLNRVALTQFFEIVSETMNTSEEKRMWRSRKRFWSGYLQYIEDAWVVFGSSGKIRAKNHAHAKQDKSFQNHGTFLPGTGSVASTHACIILKIGDIVIAEWSHNGKCRTWPYNSSDVPSLYESGYDVYSLKYGQWEQIHGGDKGGNWQDKVSRHIRYETGVSVSRSVYFAPDN